MTALKKYERLESPGLWRDQPGAQRREVIVGLREATLILSDPKSELPLTQWSLPAILRLNPGEMPALYGLEDEGIETIEIDDAQMIEALETVHIVLERRKPHPGRLRYGLTVTTAVLCVGFVVFWLPNNLNGYATKMLPSATKATLSAVALADLARLTGSPCSTLQGDEALATLAARMFPSEPTTIEVVKEALAGVNILPGNTVLVPSLTLESIDGPETLAGLIYSEKLSVDATEAFLNHAGLWATIKLLTTGAWPQGAGYGYAEILLGHTTVPAPDTSTMIAAFQSAGLSSSPYARSLGQDLPMAAALIAQDPFPNDTARPVLRDEQWLAAQSICLQ
jgi:hypothetical protein